MAFITLSRSKLRSNFDFLDRLLKNGVSIGLLSPSYSVATSCT